MYFRIYLLIQFTYCANRTKSPHFYVAPVMLQLVTPLPTPIHGISRINAPALLSLV